jgi:hypothetical protein
VVIDYIKSCEQVYDGAAPSIMNMLIFLSLKVSPGYDDPEPLASWRQRRGNDELSRFLDYVDHGRNPDTA